MFCQARAGNLAMSSRCHTVSRTASVFQNLKPSLGTYWAASCFLYGWRKCLVWGPLRVRCTVACACHRPFGGNLMIMFLNDDGPRSWTNLPIVALLVATSQELGSSETLCSWKVFCLFWLTADGKPCSEIHSHRRSFTMIYPGIHVVWQSDWLRLAIICSIHVYIYGK